MTEPPPNIVYASAVSRETVHIILTLAVLNDLEVKAAEIMSTYITVSVNKNIWTVLGPEFGEDAGKVALIGRTLYGLNSAGAAFRNHLADCMKHMGHTPCLSKSEYWMKPMVGPDDGFEY